MLQNQKALYKTLILLFLCTLPFFIGKVIYTGAALQFGQYIIPLQGRITLATILALLIVTVSYINTKNKILHWSVLALLLVNICAITISGSEKTIPNLLVSTTALISWVVTVVALRMSIQAIARDNSLFLLFQKGLCVALCIEGIVVVSQLILHEPLFPNYLQWTGQPIVFTSPSLWGITEFPRVYGTTPHPNIFAAVLLFLLSMQLFTLHKKTVLSYVNAGILILFIGVTLSKMAFIALFFLAALFIGSKYVRVLPQKILFGITVLSSTALTTITYAITPHAVGASFLETRTRIIDAYLELISHGTVGQILFGHGFRVTLASLLSQYSTITTNLLYHGRILVEVPHTLSLLIPYELGLFGTIALFFFVYKQFIELYSEKPYQPLLIALGIIVVIFSAFDHLLLY